MSFRKMFLTAAVFTVTVAAQMAGQETEQRGAPLNLLPTEPLSEPRFPKQTEPPKTTVTPTGGVRPAILNLKPAGDPIYLVEEPAVESSGQRRTYQRLKVDDSARTETEWPFRATMFSPKSARKRAGGILDRIRGSWYFANSDHRDQFRQDPSLSCPSTADSAPIQLAGVSCNVDPHVSVDGHKLYLFFDWPCKPCSRTSAVSSPGR
jgi:hypothetical protein